MDSLKLASGDNNSSNDDNLNMNNEQTINFTKTSNKVKCDEENNEYEITPQLIDDNEMKLKERIEQCKNIIESLKLELGEEKAKLEKDNKLKSTIFEDIPSTYHNISVTDNFIEQFPYSSAMYSTCVDNKLSCDENLLEYEKQLQKYQNTLNMAQIEKKNAIRKQMLAKAFRLKLLEVENQCNIELLRVKQSLQCLEPLQMIANKWKVNSEEYVNNNYNNFDLIPRYPEFNVNGILINSSTEDNDVKATTENLENRNKDDCLL